MTKEKCAPFLFSKEQPIRKQCLSVLFTFIQLTSLINIVENAEMPRSVFT